MEEPLFSSVSAGMKKKSFKYEDTLRTLSRIESEPSPDATTKQRINRLFLDHWKNRVTRTYSDQEFVQKLLNPAREKYGDEILSLEQLEQQTGVASQWRPR